MCVWGDIFRLFMAVFPEYAFKDHVQMSFDGEAQSLTFPFPI